MQPILLPSGLFLSHPDNAPDIGRGGQSKDQAGQQNRGTCPFKLAVLPVVEISRAQFDKEKDGEDHVQGRKDHVIHNRLELIKCVVKSRVMMECGWGI